MYPKADRRAREKIITIFDDCETYGGPGYVLLFYKEYEDKFVGFDYEGDTHVRHLINLKDLVDWALKHDYKGYAPLEKVRGGECFCDPKESKSEELET